MPINVIEKDGREFVKNQGTFELILSVYDFNEAGGVEGEDGSINWTFVGIVAYADDLWLPGRIDVEGEVITREHPVKLGGGQSRHSDFGGSYLTF